MVVKRNFVIVMIATLLLLGSYVFGAGAKEESGKLVVGIANHAAGNEFVNALVEGIEDELAKLDVDVKYVVADGSHEQHMANIENLITQGVKAVIIIGGDAHALEPLQKFAKNNGSVLISADTGMSGEAVLTNVTSDNVKMGEMMMEYLLEQIDYKGNIVAFQEPYYAPCDLRWTGASKVLAKYPDVNLVYEQAVEFPNGTPQAKAAMESWLQARPDAGDITAVWAVYDQPALGAVQAIHAAGLKDDIIVVGADGDQQNIMEYVSKGITQQGTVAQDSYAIGKICAEVAVQYLTGEKTSFPVDMYAELELVTSKDAAAFISKKNW